MLKILTALLIIAVPACGQSPTKNESSNYHVKKVVGWKTLSENNYSIQYPPNWELNQRINVGPNFVIYSKLEDKNDQFRDNVNLLIQDLKGQNIDLDRFVKISEDQVKTMITNPTLFESKRIKNVSPEFHKLVYSGDQGILRFKCEQYCWVINQKAYILTLTCEENKFSDYKETGEKILNSFSLK